MSYFDIKMKTELLVREAKYFRDFFEHQEAKIDNFLRSLARLHGHPEETKCGCSYDQTTMLTCFYRRCNGEVPDSYYELMADMHIIGKEMKLFHSFCEYWKEQVFDPEVGHVCHYEKIQSELVQKYAEISELKCKIEILESKKSS